MEYIRDYDDLFMRNITNLKEFMTTCKRRPNIYTDDLFEKNLAQLLFIYRNNYRRRSSGWRDGKRERQWIEVFGNLEIIQ
jgi:hypothetical protein